MSDPTEIEIKPGEPQEVISNVDVGSVPYIVEVKHADVRFAHKKRQASRGATLSAGQTHTLSNFRGSGIWLEAVEDTATVRVRPAGASFESQPPKDVTVEGDVKIGDGLDISDRRSRDVGKVRVMDSTGTLIDPMDGDLSETHPREITNTVSVEASDTISVDAGTDRVITKYDGDTVPVADESKPKPISDTTTENGESNAVDLHIGTRQIVDIAYDLSDEATVYVEVSSDGDSWRQRQAIETDGEDTILINSAFEYVRAYADSNTNTIEVASK